MPKSLPDDLGKILADHERRLNALSSGNRLDHASLDGTTLYIKDEDGSLRGRLGRQPDGSFGNVTVRVEPPPQPTAPILTVGEQAGTCQVKWDGGTFDGRRVPIVFGHVEVWAELVGGDWVPTVAPSDAAGRVGTIRDRTGGEVTVALPQAGTWAVWLRLVGADRETAGPWSPVSTVEITPLVDTEAIEQELEEARDRLEQAEQDLAAGMADRKAEIDYLREERIPALQDALVTGLDDVYREAQQYAEAQASDAVNQAAANAQSEYDRLQELAEKALSRAGDNVLEDPSFETDLWVGRWDGAGSRSVVTSSESRTGDRSVAIGGGATWNLTIDTVDVEVDDSWRLSIWYKTEGSPNLDNGSGTVLRIWEPGVGVLAESSVFEDVGDEWTRAVLTFTIPEGLTEIRATLYVTHTTGLLHVDDMALQEVGAAAEALRLAEVARQQAEAAHIAAGNAVDTAANAYDAASSKSTVHWSLSAPSGTADNTDDVWWQYELRDGKRVVIGQWFWDNGVWRETEIAEEWLPRVNIGTGTYGDLSGDRLEANTVKAGALAVMPDTEDYAPNPGRHPDLWDMRGASLASTDNNPTGVIFRFGQRSGDTQIRGPYRPVTPGRQIRFNGRYTWWGSSSTGATVHVRMEWYADENSSRLGYDTFISIPSGTYAGWVEGTVTVPEDATLGRLYLYQPATDGSDAGFWGNITCEPMVPGVMIEPEGIKSPQVDTEEFFAAQAVIEKIWADIVRSRLIQSEGIITEDMIATGAITTPKLTVTEEMVGELARFLKIEAGSLASNDIEAMRIVSSLIESSTYLIHNADGDVSVRLDGMDNYMAGRLHAGMNEETGIELDYGSKTRRRGLTDEGDPADVWTINTPYMNFTSGRSYEQDGHPSIYIDEGDDQGRDGMMIINPGYPVGTPIYRSKLNVVGDVQANRVEARNEVTSPTGFRLNTASTSQPGGIVRAENTRTRIEGRLPSTAGPHDMIFRGSSPETTTEPGTGSRGTIAFDEPSPTGTRVCQVSGHVANTTWGYDNNRVVTVSSAAASAGSMRYTRRAPSDNNGPVQNWVYFTAYWV